MKEKIIKWNEKGKFKGLAGKRYDIVETDKEVDYEPLACYFLAKAVVKSAENYYNLIKNQDLSLKAILKNSIKNITKTRKMRINFANSKFVQMFADSHTKGEGEEAERIRNRLIKRQKPLAHHAKQEVWEYLIKKEKENRIKNGYFCPEEKRARLLAIQEKIKEDKRKKKNERRKELRRLAKKNHS